MTKEKHFIKLFAGALTSYIHKSITKIEKKIKKDRIDFFFGNLPT